MKKRRGGKGEPSILIETERGNESVCNRNALSFSWNAIVASNDEIFPSLR